MSDETKTMSIQEIMERGIEGDFVFPGSTDSSGVAKGRITREFTAWCGICGEWEQTSESNNIKGAAKVFARYGWKSTRKTGWICPKCQERGGL